MYYYPAWNSAIPAWPPSSVVAFRGWYRSVLDFSKAKTTTDTRTGSEPFRSSRFANVERLAPKKWTPAYHPDPDVAFLGLGDQNMLGMLKVLRRRL